MRPSLVLVLVSVSVLVMAASCAGAPLYSSFYAPLADPAVLGYRVDVRFDEGEARRARPRYERLYGVRGRELVRELGAGRRPPPATARDRQEYSDVRFYYTYPGAPRVQ